MFQFAPPAKVARTQRGSNTSSTIVENRSTMIAGGADPCPPALCGVGRAISWRTDVNNKRVALWSHHDAWPHSLPQFTKLPRFSDDGSLRFSAEVEGAETVVFCTDRGVVSSLDNAVNFSFSNRGAPLQSVVTAFDALGAPGSETVVVSIGCEDGTVLIAQQEYESGRSVALTMCSLAQRSNPTTTRTRRWLPGWLGGGKADDSANTKGDEGSLPSPITDLSAFYQPNGSLELWAVTGNRNLSLLRVPRQGQDDAQVAWSVDLPQILGRSGIVLCTTLVEPLKSIAVLFAADSLEARGAHSLLVVLVSIAQGQVSSTVPLSGIAAGRLHGQVQPSLAAMIPVDASQLDVIYHNYVVRLNMTVGVRQPCGSEDVGLVPAAEEHGLLAAGKTADGRVLLLGVTGNPSPCEDLAVSKSTDRSVSKKEQLFESGRKSGQLFGDPITPVQGGQQSATATHIAQRLTAVISAARLDNRMSLDECILNANDEILGNIPLQVSNWARLNLDSEDTNIFNAVTKSLMTRESEHTAFVRLVLTHPDLGLALQPETLAKVLTDFEQLRALVALRQLQNQAGSVDGNKSYESPGVITTLQRQQSNDAAAVRKALKNAVVSVANRLRRDNGTDARATAAELAFSRPSNILLFLDELLLDLQQTIENQQGILELRMEACTAVSVIAQKILNTIHVCRDEYLALPNGAAKSVLSNDLIPQVRGGMPMFPQVLPLMWTSTPPSPTVISFVALLHQASLFGTATLAETTIQQKIESSHEELLRLVHVLLQGVLSLSASTTSDDFRDSVLKSVLLCFPFVSVPLGFPYGAPSPAGTAISDWSVKIALQLANEFDVLPTLYLFMASSYHADPLSAVTQYHPLRIAAEKSPKFLQYTMQAMLKEKREEELLELPQLFGEWCRVERDLFFRKQAPHLMWQSNKKSFFALREEGALPRISDAVVPYGPTLLSHRSRCVSMAKLAWAAAGEPTVKSYYDLRVDAAIVTAQAKHLSTTHSNILLTPEEAVTKLLATSSIEAAVDATVIADAVDPVLRKVLFGAIVCRALQNDDPHTLLSLRINVTSEAELVDEIGKPSCWIGRVLSTSAILREVSELRQAIEASSGSLSLDMTLQADLLNTLMSWIRIKENL